MRWIQRGALFVLVGLSGCIRTGGDYWVEPNVLRQLQQPLPVDLAHVAVPAVRASDGEKVELRAGTIEMPKQLSGADPIRVYASGKNALLNTGAGIVGGSFALFVVGIAYFVQASNDTPEWKAVFNSYGEIYTGIGAGIAVTGIILAILGSRRHAPEVNPDHPGFVHLRLPTASQPQPVPAVTGEDDVPSPMH